MTQSALLTEVLAKVNAYFQTLPKGYYLDALKKLKVSFPPNTKLFEFFVLENLPVLTNKREYWSKNPNSSINFIDVDRGNAIVIVMSSENVIQSSAIRGLKNFNF